MAEKPELKPVVQQTLEDLQHQWEELEGTTRTKAQCLFDANRAELFTQSCSALDVWLKNLESQLYSDDYGKDLTSVNILLKKHQVDHTLCHLCCQEILHSRGLIKYHRKHHVSRNLSVPNFKDTYKSCIWWNWPIL